MIVIPTFRTTIQRSDSQRNGIAAQLTKRRPVLWACHAICVSYSSSDSSRVDLVLRIATIAPTHSEASSGSPRTYNAASTESFADISLVLQVLAFGDSRASSTSSSVLNIPIVSDENGSGN